MPEQQTLTRRQAQVLKLMSRGFSRKEICLKLRISGTTLDQHAWRAYRKLGAKNCAHAVFLFSKASTRLGNSQRAAA